MWRNRTRIVSCLFCLAVLGLWFRSHGHIDFIAFNPRNDDCFSVCSRYGAVQLTWEKHTNNPFPWPRWERETIDVNESDQRKIEIECLIAETNRDVFPMVFHTRAIPMIYYGGAYRHVAIPYWLLIGIGIAIPAYRFLYELKKRKAKRQGLCLNCGYDLRATPNQCPECGEVQRTGLKNRVE